jgi:aldose 1-epimerase
VERATATDVELSCALGPAGWPLGGTVRQRIRLRPDGVRLEAEIVAERSMPAAFGWHPWFRRRPVDARLCVDAAEVLVTRDLIPTGDRMPVRGMTDLRRGPAIAGRRLDHAYVGARSPAVITWPDLELAIEFAPPASVVVVHTPPRGLCVEPQTAWPNALSADLRSTPGTGVTKLAAGESLRVEAGFSWRRIPAS